MQTSISAVVCAAPGSDDNQQTRRCHRASAQASNSALNCSRAMHEGAYAQLRLLPAGGAATIAEIDIPSDAGAFLLRVQLVAQRLCPVEHVAQTSDAVV